MNIPSMPKDVALILDTLNKNGYEGYIVGGCVRDSIMGKIPHDWDITTSATPLEVKEIFEHTVDTGIKHGTVTVVMNKQNYEITTYRIDGAYKDSRHPESVNFTRNLHEDLLRRDFTVNAIAYSPKEGYVDVFEGMKDIERKIIKGVGSPSTRFQEDALRMLRAVRFSVQLDFDIHKETLKALKENAPLIKNISIERIREELTKTILGTHIERIDILWESTLLQHIYPEIQALENGYLEDIKQQLSNIPKDIACAYGVLLRYVDSKFYDEIVTSLKFDTKTKRMLLSILDSLPKVIEPDMADIRKKASAVGIECVRHVLEIKIADHVYKAEECLELLNRIEEENQCITVKQLCIDGSDVAALGISQGILIGEALDYALSLVLEEQSMNQKTLLLKILKTKYL